MPGSRSPSRRLGGPPPNWERAAFDQTKRRSVSTIAMPTGERATICSSTARLMSQPGASASSDSSTSQREGPRASLADVIRTISLTREPPLCTAVSSPAQPPSLRHRSSSSGTRRASSASNSSATLRPTASEAGYASSRCASLVHPVTRPCASSSTGAASATSYPCRAMPCSSCVPTADLSVAESGLPPLVPIFTLPVTPASPRGREGLPPRGHAMPTPVPRDGARPVPGRSRPGPATAVTARPGCCAAGPSAS